MEQATTISSSHNREDMGMQPVLSDLQALKRLYGLLHKGQVDENLDEASRALFTRMLDDATQEALLRQAKVLSGPLTSLVLEKKLSFQSDRWIPVAERRLQNSMRSRDGHRRRRHQRHPMPELGLAPVGSNRSSRALKLPHSTRASTPRPDRKDRPRHSSCCADQSFESSRRRLSVSGHPSHKRTRHVGADGSKRPFRRQSSGLSINTAAHRGSQRAGRGLATSKQSSPSHATAVTIHSRIRPNRELSERCLRRAEGRPGRRRKDDARVIWSGRPRRTLNRIDSGSAYCSSPAPSGSFPLTSRTASSTSASCSSREWRQARRGDAQPAYSYEVASTSTRSPRRRQRRERREGRLRGLKNKLAVVFHHHHHHHFGRARSSSQESVSHRDNHRMAPWGYLGGFFHRTTGHEEEMKPAGPTAVSVPAKRRGGGHLHVLFDALLKSLWGTGEGRVPMRIGPRRTGSRVQVKKLRWWQRLRRRRRSAADAAGSNRPRLCSVQGKLV